MKNRQKNIKTLVLAGMLLALALLLPLLTGQVPQIGKMLCPMHIPVLLCGFFCGPWYALGIGLAAPLLRFLIFGMPVLMPKGLAMCAELGVYGLVSGLLYERLPKKRWAIYAALLPAMLIGRIVWGLVSVPLYGLAGKQFSWALFTAGAFAEAVPGILLQLVLIPALVLLLRRDMAG